MPAKRKSGTEVSTGRQTVRCAIYTRKSTDEGLDQDFNSLDAQRESAEQFILSQRSEGWTSLQTLYDDGGFTGANMDRPALKRLLADIEAGKVDSVVVYKVDRLTRSLLDFMKIIEMLDSHEVTFVSVTQQFNTTTSIGRLTLNMLMSFAQFEREMISERTRDKMRAARRKGKWTGGNIVLGYDVAPKGGAIIVNPNEAQRVREIFQLYLKLGSLGPVLEELDHRGWRMKQWTTREHKQRGGARFTKTTLHNLLKNVIYTGRVKFEDVLHDAEHGRIIDDSVWNAVQEQLSRNGRSGGRNTPNKYGALLKGLVRCGTCGVGMTHTYVNKANKRYRYYVCINAKQRSWNGCKTRSVSAPDLEAAVLDQLRGFVRQPAMLSELLCRIEEERRANDPGVRISDPGEIERLLAEFEPLWEHLNTREQERFIRALVKEIRYDGTDQSVVLGFRSDAIKQLCEAGIGVP